MKQDLNTELKDLNSKAESIGDAEQKKIITGLIKDILKEDNPKVEWLKDKLSKLKCWSSKAGLVITKLKTFADLLGTS
jgi:bacterioferritin (cytochrome b1)